jgi:hypothetical protein
MSLHHLVQGLTYLAAADFTGKQYHACKMTADRTVNVAGAGELVFGVIWDEPDAAGKQVHVALEGLVEVKAGAAFAAGAYLKSDASGKWIAAVSGNNYYAQAEEAATADGDIVSARITQGRVA